MIEEAELIVHRYLTHSVPYLRELAQDAMYYEEQYSERMIAMAKIFLSIEQFYLDFEV